MGTTPLSSIVEASVLLDDQATGVLVHYDTGTRWRGRPFDGFASDAAGLLLVQPSDATSLLDAVAVPTVVPINPDSHAELVDDASGTSRPVALAALSPTLPIVHLDLCSPTVLDVGARCIVARPRHMGRLRGRRLAVRIDGITVMHATRAADGRIELLPPHSWYRVRADGTRPPFLTPARTSGVVRLALRDRHGVTAHVPLAHWDLEVLARRAPAS